jgi:PKD repeat protein
MLVSTSTLPAGLTYSTTTNTISGTPTTSGTYNVELKASNSCGTDTRTVVITIEPADINQCLLPQLTSGLRQEITVGQTLSYQLVASSTSSVTITVATSSMPSWMSYSTTTKTFSGRPVDTGTYNIKVTLQNSCGVKEETITIVVSPTPPGGGGGCSGNCTTPTPGPITGGGGGNGPIVPNPTPKPEAPNSCYYLFDHLKKGWNNNPVEVKKLQVFLRDLEGFNVEITGVYDDQTINAVNAFQLRYRDDILTPWGHTAPTSFTYITTKKKVNEIYCKKAFPVTVQEQAEIDAYRNFLAELNRQGITITRPTNTIPVIVVPENIPEINEVGFIETNRNDLTTGAGVSTTTEEISNNLLASVIGSAKGLGNFLGSIISWPYNWIKGLFDRDEVGQCGQVNNCCCCNNGGIDSWFTWLLLIIIAILLYQIYREKRLYRKMMEANQELEMANKSNNLG